MSDGAGQGTSGSPAPSGWGGRRRYLLAAAVALVLVVAAVVAAIVFTAPHPPPPAAAPSTSSATSTPTPTPTATPTPTPTPTPQPPSLPDLPPGPMNILLIGSDSRGNPADQRSDTIMLIHVPADRNKVYGISIMRDNWVNIPGHGTTKINASLNFGGPQLVADTVGALLNVHIDHYVMTDFDGFRVLVDALGGIEVNVTVPFTADFDTHHTFTPGLNKLDGEAALEFVRERYAFPDGDYQRVRDQQTFVRATIAALLKAGRVHDPASAIAVIALVYPHLTVDPSLNPVALATLAYALRGTDPASSVFFTLPTLGTGTSADGQSIVLPDYRGIAEVSAALSADNLAAYAAAHGL